jgi:cytochrome c553
MKTKGARNTPDVPSVDEAFDPWEQVRPIPLFVIAVVFALAMWGLLTYMSEHAAQSEASERKEDQGPVVVTAVAASGVNDAGAAILRLVQTGKGQAWSCASCHGESGEGNLSTPRLAGQPAGYLEKQLQDFRDGLRMNESMTLVARALSEDEITDVARYYSRIALSANAVPRLGGDLARGKQIAERGDWKSNVPACVSCHGMGGEGVEPSFPALAGQQPDYIFAQLAAWHAGERKNSPQSLMDDIAQRMSPDDMRAVADYFGTVQLQAPPASGQSDRPHASLNPDTVKQPKS